MKNAELRTRALKALSARPSTNKISALVKNYELRQKEYKKNINAIKAILEGKKISVLKKFKKEMLELGKKNEFEKAIESRNKIERLKKIFENALILRNAHTADDKASIEQLRKLLDLPRIPHRIEGYDISNIQGQFATGSMVVFSDGLPNKSQYRKFKIRLGDAPNDIAMLKEVLMRRFNHPEWQYPDLVIIDGGIGQLGAALSVIPKNIPVISLAKDKRHRGHHIYYTRPQYLAACCEDEGRYESESAEPTHLVTGPTLIPRCLQRGGVHFSKKTAMPLTKMPEPVRNLILQIDAEAHRFAISYYRKLHKKATSDTI